ncbi:MAG: HigA family addiction module antitoxin [Candidatus Cryptobacteroides sp.]
MAQEQNNTSFNVKASHPGEVLSAILKQKGISQRELSEAIGKATPVISDIIKGKRNVNAEIALLLEASLGELSAQEWMAIQNLYDIEHLEEDLKIIQQKNQIATWNQLKGLVNINQLRKKANIGESISDSIKDIFKYAGVANISGLEKKIETYLSCFKKSETIHTDPKNLLTWVIIARHISNEHESLKNQFNITAINELVDSLNKILYRNTDLYKELNLTLNEFGIKFLIEEKLDKVPVDGYSFWEGDNPTIVLTKRFDRIDNFGFTLMHELGHICLHLSKDRTNDYIETDKCSEENNSGKEAEANKFATEHLLENIPYNELFKSINQPYAAANYLMAMSKNYSVNVGIIIGQYHHYLKEHGMNNPYAVCRNLIQKVNL